MQPSSIESMSSNIINITAMKSAQPELLSYMIYLKKSYPDGSEQLDEIVQLMGKHAPEASVQTWQRNKEGIFRLLVIITEKGATRLRPKLEKLECVQTFVKVYLVSHVWSPSDNEPMSEEDRKWRPGDGGKLFD
ncbi:hypothetical protein BJ508DRAFT_306811 [Ascobolus immersus RN42]|uniref:Uncharacterized protein n=1 Tax=Ascobolus immersus RN42 TaxID=1160509 RepID=A0A3N4I4Q6_ASCIM|nr:hypothetical protein BJ508DRAFT_306811 [Ascobolus immersus RN42]